MKKLWLVVALVTLGGLAANSFADVQNIRLSGDIRIRGYYLIGTDQNNVGKDQGDATFISQRTRVSVEADLEDHVLVVVTLKAEGLWGANNETSSSSGAGGGTNSLDRINRRWDVGVTEAYVQFNEIFYSAATLKLGRQYLHYGHGLIISSIEQEYNYDAARLVMDYYPVTIDVVGAQLVNNQAFASTGSSAGSADLLFINARYEMSDSVIKNIEAYFGWVAQGSSGPITASRVPPTSAGGSSPLIVGMRGDINITENFQTWFEGAYEFGDDSLGGGNELSAFLGNLGFRFTAKDAQWVPSVNGSYTYASGGGDRQNAGLNGAGTRGNGTFIPWFDYVDGYNGYLYAPMLSNIHILNAGMSVKPYENTTLSLQGYYYLKADKDGPAGSNPNVDFGGPSWSALAAGVNSADLGWEFDSILGYDYTKDVRVQFLYAIFLPGNAYRHSAISGSAHEVRGEVNVRF